MTSKMKLNGLDILAELAPEDARITVAYDTASPMEALAEMEHFARARLSSRTVQTAAPEAGNMRHPPKDAYVHYIPQYYLH